MNTPHLQLNASTTKQRNTAIAEIRDALSAHGGWILDYFAFSNISVNLKFENTVSHLESMYTALDELGLRFTRRSENAVAQFTIDNPGLDPSTTCAGTLQITFIHSDPDLRQDIPKVPG